MNYAGKLIFLPFMCMLLSACVFWPHSDIYAPGVSGVLERNGKPVPNAKVIVSSTFIEKTSIAVTNQFGRFVTDPIKKPSMIVVLIGDPLVEYKLEFLHENNRYVGFTDGLIGTAPSRIEVNCDLSNPIKYSDGTHFCVVGELRDSQSH